LLIKVRKESLQLEHKSHSKLPLPLAAVGDFNFQELSNILGLVAKTS
jgi:hypothetical protein